MGLKGAVRLSWTSPRAPPHPSPLRVRWRRTALPGGGDTRGGRPVPRHVCQRVLCTMRGPCARRLPARDPMRCCSTVSVRSTEPCRIVEDRPDYIGGLATRDGALPDTHELGYLGSVP